MLSRNIHLNCTDIQIRQNFQEGIPFLLDAAAQFSGFGRSINKIKEKIGLDLAHTNPSVDIDRMDDCLAMYHKIFDAQRISFVSAQCLGRKILREEAFGAIKTLTRLVHTNPPVTIDRMND